VFSAFFSVPFGIKKKLTHERIISG